MIKDVFFFFLVHVVFPKEFFGQAQADLVAPSLWYQYQITSGDQVTEGLRFRGRWSLGYHSYTRPGTRPGKHTKSYWKWP